MMPPVAWTLKIERRKLVRVVTDAHTVLKNINGIKDDEILNRRVEMLKRILQENITEEDGTPKEKSLSGKAERHSGVSGRSRRRLWR